MIDTKFETLLAVVNSQNYTQAAKKLHLTQPAISQHISLLEKEFNIKIFLKNGKEFKLTHEGEILVDYARKISNLYKELDTRIEDSKTNTKSLTVGITHSSESNVLIDVLAKYCTLNNGIRIKIVSDTIKNLYDKLSNYEIDFAFVEGKNVEGNYSSVLLDTDSLVAVMSNNNPLSKLGVVDVKDLTKENLILRSSGSATRTLFENQLSYLNMSLNEFNVVMEIDNIATIKDLVSKNDFTSILPKSACISDAKNKTLTILPITNMNMIREINLIYLEDSLDKKVIDDILKIYKEIVMSK